MNILKSIWAVVAGFLVVVILSIGTDTILEALNFFPPQSEVYSTKLLIIAFLYRSIYTVAGGYVTAWLAPQNPVKHVLILAILGTIGGVAGVFVGWNLSAHWYPIALAITAFPLVWWGGQLRAKRN